MNIKLIIFGTAAWSEYGHTKVGNDTNSLLIVNTSLPETSQRTLQPKISSRLNLLQSPISYHATPTIGITAQAA
ncbi:hypothetical protein [Neisseria elongata]|jgi:hypothetical protein|uniref:hypothetical protein n=1 Tax=Neisseria elongata TaxID=495 RepID=UPI00195AB806|nr:hypothetical protein [Neisseria elongata]MBM7064145.1 hypothetical protein [Neisseria elongata]